MKLADIWPKEGRFIPAVICYNNSNGIQHLKINQYVYPYREELLGANNAFIFIDSDENITGGQVGRYDEENGLHTVFFTESPDECETPSPVPNPAPPNKPACTSCGPAETSEKKLEMHGEK